MRCSKVPRFAASWLKSCHRHALASPCAITRAQKIGESSHSHKNTRIITVISGSKLAYLVKRQEFSFSSHFIHHAGDWSGPKFHPTYTISNGGSDCRTLLQSRHWDSSIEPNDQSTILDVILERHKDFMQKQSNLELERGSVTEEFSMSMFSSNFPFSSLKPELLLLQPGYW